MGTVSDVVTKFDALAVKGVRAMDVDLKISLLNMGKDQAWSFMTGSNVQEDWFTVVSQFSTPANPDYFAPFAAGTREYALPPNFHTLRSIEVSTSGYQHLSFVPRDNDDREFEWRRNQTDVQFDSEVLYDIVGTNPGTMVLASAPPATINVVLRYVRTPTEWTALADTGPDEFPNSALNMIAEWAVQRASLGTKDGRWGQFVSEWSNQFERWLRTHRRESTEPDYALGFLE